MKYYTDPLKAALMARDYGVRLISRGGAELHNFGLGIGAKTKLLGIVYHQPPYYVTPDSEHIFQPQKNDFGEDAMGSPCLFNGGEWVSLAGERGHWVTATVEITRRNGKAFFMPEAE